MQIKISLPQELYEKVREECKKSYRTLSGEIAFRVKTTFEPQPQIDRLVDTEQSNSQTQAQITESKPLKREGDFLW